MEFTLTEDFVKENELSEKQVEAIKGHIEKDFVPTIRKEFDGVANTNAEKILDGAAKKAREQFGVTLEREQGEKYADYISRIAETAFSNTKNALAEKQKELDEKLKNFKGGDEYKEQLSKLQEEKDTLLKQVAELEPLKEKALKADEYSQQLSGLKLSVAFNEVKPTFPETVNPYEAKAKWDDFKSGILEKYNIEIVDGKAIAVDKENQYKQTPLADLVKGDTNITELLQGRKQPGTGAVPQDLQTIEGVPFQVPKDADSTVKTNLVREYLTKKGLDTASAEYKKQFEEIYLKISKKAA